MKWWRLLVVALLLAASVAWLFFLASMAPISEEAHLHFPSNLEELRRVSDLISGLSRDRPSYALILFASAYLFKQSFAIPGSFFLNVLAGAVFGLPAGLSLCCGLTAAGASCCYAMARFCGAGVAEALVPDRVADFRRRLREAEGRLAYFLLALRLFPASPNWAINVSCGVLRVPLAQFFLTVLLGLAPYNYLCVQTGVMLASIENLSDAFSWTTLAQLGAMALVATLPGIIVKNKSKA